MLLSADTPSSCPALAIEAFVVAGFLGAGKTTLIEQVLIPTLAAKGVRAGLIVNDAGAFNYDALRLHGHLLPLWEVAGGCGCCGAQGALAEAIAQARATAALPLIVECSGLAAPEPVVAALQAQGLTRITVITLIAAPNGLGQLASYPDLARAQLAAADAVVISAAEETANAQITALSQALPNYTRAPIWYFCNGNLTPHTWWETLALLTHPASGTIPLPAAPDPPHGELMVRSESLSGWYTREQLATWLTILPPGVVRLKGVAALVGSFFPVAFDRNGWAISFHPLNQQAPSRWFAVGTETGLAAILSPAPISLAAIPWDEEALWLPLGSCDSRPQVAWCDGSPLPPQEAARRWEALWQKRTANDLVVTRHDWQAAAAIGWRSPAQTFFAAPSPATWLAALLAEKAPSSLLIPHPRLFAVDVPWPAVEAACQIARWPLAHVIHCGRYWSAPAAGLSLVVPANFIESGIGSEASF